MKKHSVFNGLAIAFLVGLLPVLTNGATRFGPYEALSIDQAVIHGVKVEESGKIWLLLNPDHRDREIVVKISNLEGADYRKWHNGSYELVSPANQGKLAGQWTDWLETKSRFIEYWMDGRKILHLKKIE